MPTPNEARPCVLQQRIDALLLEAAEDTLRHGGTLNQSLTDAGATTSEAARLTQRLRASHPLALS
ncbi:MAG: hypothetical protein JHD16_00095 [Solirubrobacteraceae bacterium]|nr:hypothetical protein [Solirubrobacteraceae bacterium]